MSKNHTIVIAPTNVNKNPGADKKRPGFLHVTLMMNIKTYLNCIQIILPDNILK